MHAVNNLCYVNSYNISLTAETVNISRVHSVAAQMYGAMQYPANNSAI